MTRVNVVLLLAVVLSALYLVDVQYESRRLFSELDRSRAQAHKLDVDNERLQVERRAQANSARIEHLAKTKLQMRAANPAITTYVAYTVGDAQASAQTGVNPGPVARGPLP